MPVVHDFMPDIDWRAIFLERALDNIDSANDASAKAARLRQNNFKTLHDICPS